MAELLVGKIHEFDDDERKIVTVRGRDVVVFQRKGRFYALDNTCLHMGGPVGEGLLILMLAVVVGLFVFGGNLPSPYDHYPQAFLCIPPLLWSA